ncbi:MAG: DUF2283 domain-containing protein [Candidatus Latescibacterota bacterium]
MNKPFIYFPDSDTLEITLANGPASKTENAGADGEHDNILFSYDNQGRIISITIDVASQAVNLSNIIQNDQNIIDGSSSEIFTTSSLAKALNISQRTIQKTIKTMSESGIQIGIQNSVNGPIILRDSDARKIEEWRAKHLPGRPKTVHT